MTNTISQRLGEFIRYALGCACSLLLKMVINALLTAWQIALPISYVVATVAAVLFAFFYHRHITFQASAGRGWQRHIREFVSYLAGVSLFCLLDYLIVVMAAAKLKECLQRADSITMAQVQLVNNVCILVSAGAMFVIRFFVYRLIFRNHKHN